MTSGGPGTTPRRNRSRRPALRLLLLLIHSFAVPAARAAPPARDVTPPAADPRLADVPETWVQLLAGVNPLSLVLYGGGYYRIPYAYSDTFDTVWSHLQVGAWAGANPAYVQGAAYGEWMPVALLKLRVQYQVYGFTGLYGSLMSFAAPEADYSDETLRERAAEAEPGVAHHVLLQPTLRLRLGDVAVKHVAEFNWYHVHGDGPFFNERDHDTIIAREDWIFENRTELLWFVWEASDHRELYLGPFFQETLALETEDRRRRVGLHSYLAPYPHDPTWGLLYLYMYLGVALVDRHRQGELFGSFGVGMEWFL